MMDVHKEFALYEKLGRLIIYALTPSRCLAHFSSGVCPHPANDEFYMHVCEEQMHSTGHHKCLCGKEWTDVIPGR